MASDREALKAIRAGLAADNRESGDFWEARALLDKLGIYHENLSGTRVLLELATAALAVPPSARDEKPHIQVDEALSRLGLTSTTERRDIMRGILGLDGTGAPVHRNVHGQPFTDEDLRKAGQDWGDSSPLPSPAGAPK